jgi:hypothetical protein
VDHHIEILNHDKDYNNVDLHEMAIFHFSVLSSKVKERPTKKQEDDKNKKKVFYLQNREHKRISLAFVTRTNFRYL